MGLGEQSVEEPYRGGELFGKKKRRGEGLVGGKIIIHDRESNTQMVDIVKWMMLIIAWVVSIRWW